jgi:nitroreductase
LQAVALGLGTVMVAGIRADDMATALALADGERPIYVLPLGRPR